MNLVTRRLAAAVLAMGLVAPAFAAPVTYAIDPTHTFPRFSYNHLGLSTQLSRFNQTSGTVVYDKAKQTASIDVVIDMKSVDTGFATFNQHIQGADFLDTAKYPAATFKSTRVTFKDGTPTAIDGNLTIKGITRPVTLQVNRFVNTVHPMLKKDAIGADASTTIKRSEFNAGQYVPAVGDEVTISIALEAVQQ